MTREFPLGRVFTAFAISTFIFILFFSIAHYVSYLNYKDISGSNNALSLSLSNIESYVNLSSCDHSYLIESSNQLDDVASKLAILEKRFGKEDERVLEQKKLYNEIEITHSKLIDKLNSVCNNTFRVIFFFYSNEADLIDESDNMGYILDTFKSKHLDNVMIYSFDYDLNSSLINALKEEYQIEEAPIVLINENEKTKISNINQLETSVFDSNK